MGDENPWKNMEATVARLRNFIEHRAVYPEGKAEALEDLDRLSALRAERDRLREQLDELREALKQKASELRDRQSTAKAAGDIATHHILGEMALQLEQALARRKEER